jgi:hypothetical protein
MAKRKSRKQQRIEARDKAASRRFALITIGVTVALIILLYAIYSNL